MAQPHSQLESYWHPQAIEQNRGEFNPVVTPYKHVDALELFDNGRVSINKRLVRMADGTEYFVTSSDIKRHVPAGVDGLGHYEGVAYTTWPEGLYVERLKKLANKGIEGSVFSIPDNIGKFIKYTDNINNYLSLTNNEALEHDRDPQVALYSGISQGAMNGTGYIALSPHHDINVLAAHLNVLCLPDGIKLTDAKYLPGHLIETLTKMPNELLAILSLVRMNKEKRGALLPTADVRRLKALPVQLQMLPSLLSGGTGKYARKMGEDMPIYAELNDGDALSRSRRWINSYIGDRPNVKIKYSKRRSHADCISELSQSDWTDFIGATAQILIENPSIRLNPKTAGAKILELMRTEFPQFAKTQE